MAQDRRQRRPDLQMGRPLDLCTEPAVFRRHAETWPSDRGHCRRARSWPVSRFDHDRPHLTGRIDQGRKPCRRIPARSSGAPEGLQPVRHATRQSRSHDARHVRQYPHQEPDGAWGRGRLHDPLSVASAHDHVRCSDALQIRARAARGLRRQGIRHRLVARLGGQGHGPARHSRGDRAVIRTHSSLESGRHGRGSSGIRGGHVVADARIERRRAGHHSRPARRSQAASAPASGNRCRRRRA